MKTGVAAVTEDLERFVTTFHNPEVAAMAAICDILEDLPDDDARLRVMRWSFGKFNPEFKRPLPPNVPEKRSTPTLLAPRPVVVLAPTAPVPTAAPAAAAQEPEDASDMARQIDELNDLFPARAVREPFEL